MPEALILERVSRRQQGSIELCRGGDTSDYWRLSSVGAQRKSNNWSSQSFAKLTLGLAPAVFSLIFFIDQSVEWGNHFYNMKGHLIEKSQGLPIMPIVKT